MNGTEKRRARRFAMRLPVAVRGEAEHAEQRVETRDVSSSGIFFEFAAPIAVGIPVEFLLTLPEPITKGSPVRIRCMGKVVRVEQGVQGETHDHVGVAATIERYEFVREA
jgi:hypothetical protein